MRGQSALLPLAIGGLALAVLVLGLPNVAVATGFVTGEDPTGVAALAAAVLLIWIPLLVGAIVVLVRTLRCVPVRLVSARVLVGLMIAVGVAVLGVGLARHGSNEYSMCCGSISQARQQLANAP